MYRFFLLAAPLLLSAGCLSPVTGRLDETNARLAETNSFMASKINRRILSVEVFFTSAGRYNRNSRNSAARLRRDFLIRCQSADCTQQLCRVNSTGPFASAR